MTIYKAKQFDKEKIEEIMKAHPYKKFEIGMKEDWEMLHKPVSLPLENLFVDIVDSSWWDTPIMKIYDGENNLITIVEVWKEIEFESTEENYELHKELLRDMKNMFILY